MSEDVQWSPVDGSPYGRKGFDNVFFRNLEASVLRCVCGFFDREYTFVNCPSCGTNFDLLTQWWREMDDRFWGMSKEELREDFETWRVLSAEIVEP